jgi:AcrR family transcriptional regulator
MTRAPGQRAGLTREAVISAARAVADREGLERLSMRALASELGVMPNALYSHVNDKTALLDGLLDCGDCLDLLAHGGIEGELAVRGFRALLVYTIGFSAYEAPRREDPDPEGRAAASAEAFRAAGHGRATAQAQRLAAMPSAEDFHAGLEWMLDGLVAQAK